MHLLGRQLPDHKLLKIALTSFYGISHYTSFHLLARLQIPLSTKVSELSESQITSLSAFLSSPSTAPKPPSTPLSINPFPSYTASTSSLSAENSGSSSSSTSSSGSPPASASAATGRESSEGVVPSVQSQSQARDPLEGLLIETDLRRKIQGDIQHLRQVGTYRGRRHALGLPVRGQNTRNNAQTAKKLNRVDRRHYSSSAMTQSYATDSGGSGSRILDVLRSSQR